MLFLHDNHSDVEEDEIEAQVQRDLVAGILASIDKKTSIVLFSSNNHGTVPYIFINLMLAFMFIVYSMLVYPLSHYNYLASHFR